MLMAALVLAGCWLIAVYLPPASALNDYYASIVNKHRRLETLKSPKIILVGGSNLVFGVDSRQLERAFGRPVVNMALNAGLGVAYELNEVRQDVKPGDIVLVSTEYYDGKTDLNALALMLQSYPALEKYVELNLLDRTALLFAVAQRRVIERIPLRLGERWGKPPHEGKGLDEAYKKTALNRYGDVKLSVTRQPGMTIDHYRMQPFSYEDNVRQINRFADYARGRSAEVYYCYPSTAATFYRRNRALISGVERQMRQALKIKIVGAMQEYVFPDKLFYDTSYHLTGRGREIRTAKLINELRQAGLGAKTRR